MQILKNLTVDGSLFRVLINSEGQFSTWPKDKVTPSGWKDVDYSGSMEECKTYIDSKWTDMRPLSLIKQTITN
jgi:MbtH protein